MKPDKTENKTEKSEEKRQHILTEAAKCFSHFGFEKTTLDDIGKAARLNKATLYYYFKNKEEIFMTVVLQESAKFAHDLQSKTTALQNFEEKILTYLIERLRYYKNVVNLHQLSIVLLQQIQPIFDELYHKVEQEEIAYFKEILSTAQQQRQISSQYDALSIAESLIIVANVLKHEAILQSKAQFAHQIDYSPIEEKTTFVIQLILNGLKK
jgi:AcrR family transcriptional regulator